MLLFVGDNSVMCMTMTSSKLVTTVDLFLCKEAHCTKTKVDRYTVIVIRVHLCWVDSLRYILLSPSRENSIDLIG